MTAIKAVNRICRLAPAPFIDDVFALGILHVLQSRGECRIVAVTVSKDHPLSAPFCDVLNTFYGRSDLPVGVLRTERPGGDGPYLQQAMKPRDDGSPAFPHALRPSSDAPLAVSVLRKELAGLREGSAVPVAFGPLTNIRDLLISAPDQHSLLDGRALVAAKVRTLVVMAGDFGKPRAEFDVFSDLDAASSVFTHWPTKLVACPCEMGEWPQRLKRAILCRHKTGFRLSDETGEDSAGNVVGSLMLPDQMLSAEEEGSSAERRV